MPAITTQQTAGFRVAQGRDYQLKSSGHRITVREIDKKGGEVKVYLHSVNRNAWISITLLRAWYVPATTAE